MRAQLVRHVMASFPNGECRQQRPNYDVADAEIEGFGAKSVGCGQPSCCPCACGECCVAGKFVQSHCEAALLGSDEVNLHDDCHGPGESLAPPEKHVCHHDPFPPGRPHQEQRHWNRHEPTSYQDVLTTEAVGQPSSNIVGERFGDSEDDNERQDGRLCGNLKLLLCDCGQDAALEAHHRTHKRVDDYQQ